MAVYFSARNAPLVEFPQDPTQAASMQTSIVPTHVPLKIVYVHSTILQQFLKTVAGHVLALIKYSSQTPPLESSNCLTIEVAMPQISEMELVEVWLSESPVSFDQTRNIRSAWNNEILLGCLEFEETSEDDLEGAVRHAYEQILTFCDTAGYANLFRMWNYFPAIHAKRKGLERYKRFCVGRHEAFALRYPDLASILPAASAVGTQGSLFQLIFLAGKRAGTHLENPRQVSAYHYPSIYGPTSPSFSRATLGWTSKDRKVLFVAGTASIVGHATLHLEDPIKQTRETLTNIETLLEEHQLRTGETLNNGEATGLLKVYIRQEMDYGKIKEVLSSSWCRNLPAVFLRGQLCRKDILVEVEGIWCLG